MLSYVTAVAFLDFAITDAELNTGIESTNQVAVWALISIRSPTTRHHVLVHLTWPRAVRSSFKGLHRADQHLRQWLSRFSIQRFANMGTSTWPDLEHPHERGMEAVSGGRGRGLTLTARQSGLRSRSSA
jgi:hypothetical protein